LLSSAQVDVVLRHFAGELHLAILESGLLRPEGALGVFDPAPNAAEQVDLPRGVETGGVDIEVGRRGSAGRRRR
jgi:hypothetical protein